LLNLLYIPVKLAYATVGAVTGVVGAAGGLGGFIPPLVMGSLYGHYADYGIGLLLLAVVAAAAAVFTILRVARPVALAVA